MVGSTEPGPTGADPGSGANRSLLDFGVAECGEGGFK